MASRDRMEDVPPPPPREVVGSHRPADAGALVVPAPGAPSGPSIVAAAAAYRGDCAGVDAFVNNCAHFLSDAFIRVGYDELLADIPYIHARCCTFARRPIRARNMWEWFQSKARLSTTDVQRGTGFWAVFQLEESEYWGGHVVIIDTDSWTYFGTGNYPAWHQHAYQWWRE